ncbi:MAG: hypothetical protein IJA34_16950 [Lachnospiraceae bacterium]|nr:hypothetical protein [Lachnospiraceae bacterium]
MNETTVLSKLSFVMRGDELQRIHVDEVDSKLEITIDLHQFKCKDAKRILQNIINVNRCSFTLHVIHGYNHGTAIKAMIYEQLNTQRIIQKSSPTWNPGETYIEILESI